MKIHTYHDDVQELPNHRAMVAMWRERWATAGWEPVVLCHADAQRHPDYARLATKFSRLPTVNPKGYELACYLRWVAMAVVGGGWMSDSDVIPYGFKPRTATQRLTLWSGGPVPCLVSGDALEYLRMAERFAGWQLTAYDHASLGQSHCSDQNILHQIPGEFDKAKDCVEVGHAGWKGAAVVHYATVPMAKHQPKHLWIPKLRT